MPRPERSPYDSGKTWLTNSRAGAAALAGVAPIRRAKVIADHAQILTFPAAEGGVEVVSAQGEGTIIQLIAASVVFDDSAGTYSTEGGGNNSWSLQVGGELVSSIITGPLAGPAGVHYGWLTPWLQPNTAGDWDGNLTLGSFFDVSALVNQPLVFQDYYSPPTSYINGHADNTLVVSAAYYILNTVTGEFE